ARGERGDGAVCDGVPPPTTRFEFAIMNINKYTAKARAAVASAIELAQKLGHPQIEPEHLLVALIEQRDGVVPELVRKMSLDPAAIASAARDLLKNIPQSYGGSQPGM